MKTKTTFLVNLISLLLTAVIIASFALCSISPNNSIEIPDTYTVCDDGDYYSETTYYLNEAVYKQAKADIAQQNNRQRATVAFASAANTEADKTPNEEFVFAARKNVWVSEQTNENGEIIESRLLKKSEIEDLNTNEADSGVVLTSSTLPPEYIGEDRTSKYLLTVDMNVFYNVDTEKYLVTGNAHWEAKVVFPWQSKEAAEEGDRDYMAITWGGDNLYAEDNNMTGYYYGGGSVQFSKTKSDSYIGFIWDFHEKSGYLGKEMNIGTANVTLKRIAELKNKQTSVKLTYIHTYAYVNTEFSFTASPDGLAATVTMKHLDNSWNVEIDVPKINY